MKIKNNISTRSIFLLVVLLTAIYSPAQDMQPRNNRYITGAAQSNQYLPLLKGKKVGMAINHTSLINGQRSIDYLLAQKVQVTKIFSPEHGAYGKISANTKVEHEKDEATGLPVISLFGEKLKPTKNDLENVDVIVFDMQDVGVRFYTYISTMHYIMQAGAAYNIPVIILDRANPNDAYIDGPVLDTAYSSFIGMHPVPIVHGMTIGEYAQMINGEGWLGAGLKVNLTVIPLKNYYHGKPFIYEKAPSPNLNTEASVYLYPSLCWFGATAISDGRGTYQPYLQIGHPLFRNTYTHAFIPQPITGMNENPKHKGDTCYGLDLSSTDPALFKAGGKLNLSWLLEMYNAFADKQLFFNGEAQQKKGEILHFDYLAGSDLLRKQIHQNLNETDIRKSWEEGLKNFRLIRNKYLLYPDIPGLVNVMTYNIHHGYNAVEENRLSEMKNLLATIDADIIALQEVDSVCTRSGNMDETAFLAKEKGYYYHFSRHFSFQGGAYGNAILSRYPFEKIENHRLPVADKEDGVVFQTATVQLPSGQKIMIANIHMDYRDKDSRINQSILVKKILERSLYPVILLGDFNVQPGDSVLKNYQQFLQPASNQTILSFPAETPNRTLDYIYASPSLKLIHSYTYPVKHSDHLPVISILQESR